MRRYSLAAAPFEAARQVTLLPEGHPCGRLHGHSFLARVRAELPAGWATFPGAEARQLAEQLADGVAPLNYRLLNDHLQVPTDENLVRWIRRRLAVPGIETVGVQSTRDQGADLDDTGQAHSWRRFRFEAAHRLPHVPQGHPCGRMHGHGFEVILHAHQDRGDQAMGVDVDQLGECWKPLQQELHYRCLNDIPGLENPTSERLAYWVWQRLKPVIPPLSWVTVYETVTAGCHYDGEHYRIWKEQRFESALRLLQAPEDDPRGRLHGHSYRIRLHLSAPLDEVMGWTVDYGDVKTLFKPLYQQLDHQRLDELEGIADADLASLLQWIRVLLTDCLPQLDRIDLYESPQCGAVLCWGAQRPALPV